MKRVSIWLFLVLLSAGVGFSAAKQNPPNRPKIVFNRHLVAALLKNPVTPNSVCNHGSKWRQLRCRFREYEKENSRFVITEDWTIHDEDTTKSIPVTVIHNTFTDEVTIVCKRKKCAQ